MMLGVRVQPDLLSALDNYRADQASEVSRPEAIRVLLTATLIGAGYWEGE